MEEKYKIAFSGGENEIIEKKSRFIASVLPITSEEEAATFIESIRKKYWSATHNCFAFVLGARHEVQRCSDDGEPSGTAGRPMLDVLLLEDIHNVVVVVTRYFGGTLLGTGGLVRAYTKAVQEGLLSSTIVEKCPGRKYVIQTDYNGVGKIQYILGQMELITLDTEYTDKVRLCVMVPMEQGTAFEKKIIEATAGRAKIDTEEEIAFCMIDGKIQLF